MEILVVEEGNANASLVVDLGFLGHSVGLAADTEEAWQLLGQNRFQLVFANHTGDGQDGLQLCLRIRARPSSKYIYVILQAAKDAVFSREQGLEAGADDFLTLPFTSDELATRIRVARRILTMQQEINSSKHEPVSAQNETQTAPLGSILVAQGVIDPEQLRNALAEQARTGTRLGPILTARHWATEEQITAARSVQLDVSDVAVANETPDPFILALVSREDALRHLILPLSAPEAGGDSLPHVRLAMADPWNIEGIDLIQRQTRRRVEPLLANEAALRAAIERAYSEARGVESGVAMADSLASIDISSDATESEEMDVAAVMRMSDEAPVVSFVNTLLADAVRRRASDIHIEPRKSDFQIRYRMDGQLHVIRKAPAPFLAPTASRIKIMAEMDISERRLPQDGRMTVRVEGPEHRPAHLDAADPVRRAHRRANPGPQHGPPDAGQAGLHDNNLKVFDSLISQPHGILLVTGPTGSGKTTTLYSALNALKNSAAKAGDANIITCEDPIEYELEGISQSNVNEKAGLNFARQLRSIMRQDPDVILVGEIRDGETAEIAVRAAMTGHLVLSTLHCNEAAGAVSRLLDLGLPPFLIGSSMIGVVAQRLVRRLCPACKKASKAPPEMILGLKDRMTGMAGAVDDDWTVYEPGGCKECDNAGTKGRLALHEVLVVNEPIRRLIAERADTSTIRRAAMKSGMIPLINDGVQKALNGKTSLQDVPFKVGLPDDEPDEQKPGLQIAA